MPGLLASRYVRWRTVGQRQIGDDLQRQRSQRVPTLREQDFHDLQRPLQVSRMPAQPEREFQMTNPPATSLAGAPPLPGGDLDRLVHAQFSHLTGGISPAAMRMAFEDWLTHLSHNPAEQADLARKSVHLLQVLSCNALQALQPSFKPCIEPKLSDRRFSDPGWQAWPLNVISQAFLLNELGSSGTESASRHSLCSRQGQRSHRVCAC